ncbi:aromatic acid exporter family protein [Streptomyces sp. SL13]|uniref:Aromatic acid exporter family protein n=1 Tax=Streptantibioticus silvisoli TaxID=2705255 RepID=A0AA90KFS2_9ACTN|nr:aromatic acid exporter family protein [Streptantibioticus silvisoli]MDI5969254.1 aromatic acid exporter family protein [Streptantibioticus silvisoli]
MRAVPARLVGLIKRRNEPVLVQFVRSTVAAMLSYVVALHLVSNPRPLTAPLTALLVVQVTLYTTLTTGVRRVLAVVAGVLIAVGFSEALGLRWWSLGLIIMTALLIGHAIRVDEFVAEVAISGMLILGVSTPGSQAWDRVAETLIGAGVGVLLNAFFAPPVFVQTAGQAVQDLAEWMASLLRRIGNDMARGAAARQAASWLAEARTLDNEISRFDASLRRAEESTRLNPRVRQGAMARLVLRSGLDTMEVCAVLLRAVCRSLRDLAPDNDAGESLYEGEVALSLERLMDRTAAAVDNFGQLITAQVSAGADQAEEELARALREGRAERDRLAAMLRAETERNWEGWEMHGALLASIDRIMDELDVERRSRWLAEQVGADEPVPGAMVNRLRRGARSASYRLRRGPGPRGG